MRTFRHWTPAYIANRLRVLLDEKTNPNHPWLTKSAVHILESYLKDSDIGLEFGSGRSTLWFAKRVAHITSVEDDVLWLGNVRQMLMDAHVDNVDYRFLSKEADNSRAIYVGVIEEFDKNSLDFCLVDGSHRDLCALGVLEKIRPGGILIIDNVNWYLPSDSYSPNSKSYSQGPGGPAWQEIAKLISTWRKIWTTNGVTDTAFFFKPCATFIDPLV